VHSLVLSVFGAREKGGRESTKEGGDTGGLGRAVLLAVAGEQPATGRDTPPPSVRDWIGVRKENG
jgi:hypothetical protein